MSKKMLIDAGHPEETRVVVADGNDIDDFDFESEAKKQIKGNIDLARVTRVEPSLQAAFVEYGGNRHGFMAFSEIHPDYYQIPVADRERLLQLQAEAEERRAAAEAAMDEEEETEEKPARRRRGGRSRAAAKTDDTSAEAGEEETSETEADANAEEGAEEDVENASDEETSEITAAEDDTVSEEAVPEEAEEETAEVEASDETTAEEEQDETSKKVTALLASANVEVLAIDDEALENVDWNDDDEDDDPDDIEPLDPALEEVDDVTDEDDEDAAEDGDDETEASNAEGDDAEASESGTEGEEGASRTRGRGRRGRGGRGGRSSGGNGGRGGRQSGRSGGRGGRSGGGGRGRSRSDSDDDLDVNPRPFFKNYKIQEVIRRRQVLLVQVAKEERGNKGAALTTYLSLAGRYCVLMPNTARGGGISRKITNMSDRRRLKTIVSGLEVPKGMGLIVRTAGANRTKAEIRRDYDYLIRLWESIRDLTLKSSAPSMIYEEGNLIKRSIRDLYSKDLDEVLVEGQTAYKEAKAFMRMLMPSHARRVKLYTERTPLFQRFKVDVQLDSMLSPRVDMPSGGYIIINQTEALVSVDVNSGRSTKEHNIEDTALKTNLEAAEEVARQLRMRDLAGLIVIDFIDMEEHRNNRSVERRLKDCLAHDRARLQVGRISNFGLLEMSRQRLRAGILEGSTRPCPHCEGAGIVRSVESAALRILRACGEEGVRERSASITVTANSEVAEYIQNHKRRQLIDFEDQYGMHTNLQSDRVMPGDVFELKRGEPLSDARRQQIQESSTVSLDSAYLAAEEAKDAEAEAKAQAEEDAIEAEEAEAKPAKPARAPRKRRTAPKDVTDEAAETGESAEATETKGPEGEEDEDGSPRRRRRGRRGGKRNRRRRERADADGSSEDSADGEAAEATQDASGEEASSTQKDEPADGQKEKSGNGRSRGRRSSRPRTRRQPEMADADAGGANGEVKDAEASEKPRTRRRSPSTRPKPAAKEDAPSAPAPSPSSSTTEPSGAQGDAKKGWWQRTFFN